MKLDLLAPAELTRALARVYVYNMNSTFRQVPPRTYHSAECPDPTNSWSRGLVVNVSGGCFVFPLKLALVLSAPRTSSIS